MDVIFQGIKAVFMETFVFFQLFFHVVIYLKDFQVDLLQKRETIAKLLMSDSLAIKLLSCVVLYYLIFVIFPH